MTSRNERPAASVILPVFNAGRHLEAAVDSVLSQDFRDFELLLLDDGSTDGSGERLAAFARRDPRCRLHAWPNRGLIATLNEGVRLARADILIRMDADDLCRPGRFSRQLAYLGSHPECVAVGSRVMLIDEDGWPICEFAAGEVAHEEIDAAHLAGRGGSLPHPSAALRREAVVRAGGYRAGYVHAEDVDLFLRLAEVGRLANLTEVLLDYRQHASGVGYRHARQQQESARRAVEDACARRGVAPPLPAASAAPAAPSPAEVHRKWGWWALGAGNRGTAWKHALRGLRLEPLGREGWKLLACVARGR